jgi:hypothetical protein
MGLPAQVERDLKDIEEMEKAIAAQNAPAEDNGLGESEPETAAEVVNEDDKTETQQAQEQPDSPVEAKEDFEHKYKTLRGKYDAEVPRLHSQVKELMHKVDVLTEQLNTKPEEPPTPETYVTDADKEAFGEDLIDVQRRVAREVGVEYERKIAKLESVIEQLTSRLDGTDNSVSEMSFEQRLSRLVPDFAAVNADPKWIAWLNEVDPILRGPRRGIAQHAFQQGDAEAVAEYVRLFKASLSPEQNTRNTRQAELEKQVTPNRNTTTSVPRTTDNKPRYTKAQQEATWKRIDTLNMAGRYDEANKLEAEISSAMLEGRAEF